MVELMLRPEQARDVAAIAKAASTDAARPILTGVCIEWRQGEANAEHERGYEFTFTATDSYILSTRVVDEYFDLEVPNGEDTGVFLAPGKEMAKALRDCTVKKLASLFVKLTIGDGTLTVSTADGAVNTTLSGIEGTFPNWRQLLPDEPVFEGYEGAWPGLRPDLIKRVLESGGGDPTRTVRFGFMQRTDGAELKPIVYQSAGDENWLGLQMPVRL